MPEPHERGSLTGRIGLNLTVLRPSESSRWYRDVFGFDVHSEFTEADGHIGQVCLRDAGSGFVLCLVDHRENAGDRFDERRTGLDHLEFFVDSPDELDKWAARLDQLGIANSGVKQPTWTRNRMITFRDPDNIQLELFWEAGPEL
jgi:glyoxylase I family protein